MGAALVLAGFGLVMLICPRPFVRFFALYRSGSVLSLASRVNRPDFGVRAVRTARCVGLAFLLGGIVAALAA